MSEKKPKAKNLAKQQVSFAKSEEDKHLINIAPKEKAEKKGPQKEAIVYGPLLSFEENIQAVLENKNGCMWNQLQIGLGTLN